MRHTVRVGRFGSTKRSGSAQNKQQLKAQKKAARRGTWVVFLVIFVVGGAGIVLTFRDDSKAQRAITASTTTTAAVDGAGSTTSPRVTSVATTTSSLPVSGDLCKPDAYSPIESTLSRLNADVDDDGILDLISVFATPNSAGQGVPPVWYLRVDFGAGAKAAQTQLVDLVGRGSLRINGMVRLSSGRLLATELNPRLAFPAVAVTVGQSSSVHFMQFFQAKGCVLAPIVDSEQEVVRFTIGASMKARYTLQCTSAADGELLQQVTATVVSETSIDVVKRDRRFDGTVMASSSGATSRLTLPAERAAFDAMAATSCAGLVIG